MKLTARPAPGKRDYNSVMRRELARIVHGFEHAQARLEALAEDLPDNLWIRRNDPSRWSPAECVAHLNLTSDAYIPLIQAALEQARNLPRATNAYRRDFLGALFGLMTGPIPSIGGMRMGRVKTMPDFVPTGDHPKHDVLARFKEDQNELIGLAKEADGLALDKVMIRSPFGGKIQYNCYSAFVILPRHQERHLDQAAAVWSLNEE